MADILFGTVTDTKDPEGLARVSVSLTDHGDEVILPWIRVIQPMASASSGVVWLPDVDDNVVVLAGSGGVESMVVLGSVYSGNRKPPGDAVVGMKHFLTPGGNELLFDDTDGSERIVISTKEAALEIVLDQATPEITINAGDAFTLKAKSKVVIQSGEVEITGDSDVKIKGGDVSIDGGAIEIKGSGTVKISGSKIELG